MPDLVHVGVDRPDDRDERHQQDRRERRERHVEPAVDDDHVIRAGLEVEPGASVEERVREVEEVAPARRRSHGPRASR